MMEERRVKLGVVGVDSGQILVIDPSYLDEHWRRGGEAVPHGLRFWGRDAAIVRDRLAHHPVVARIERQGEDHVYMVHLKPPTGLAAERYPREIRDVDSKPSRGRGARHVTAWALRSLIRGLARMKTEDELSVVWEIANDSSYQQVCELTGGANGGGQLNYAAGHAGLGVASSTGGGDGTYEVWATLRDLGMGWGERVTRLEVVFIPVVLGDDDESTVQA